MGTAAEEGK